MDYGRMMAEIVLDGPLPAAWNALGSLLSAGDFSDINSAKALSYVLARELEYDLPQEIFFAPNTYTELLSAQHIPALLRFYAMWFSRIEFFGNLKILDALAGEVTDHDVRRLQRIVRRNSMLQHEALRAYLVLVFFFNLMVSEELSGGLLTDIGLQMMIHAIDTCDIIPGDNADKRMYVGRGFICKNLSSLSNLIKLISHEFGHLLQDGIHMGGHQISPTTFSYKPRLPPPDVQTYGRAANRTIADIETLQRIGATKEYETNTDSLKQAISSAARYADVNLVRFLLQREAIRPEHASCIDAALLNVGTDIFISSRGETFSSIVPPLNAIYGVIESLCKAGANPNQPLDDAGNTLLIDAAGRSVQLTRLLLKIGADINCANQLGTTPLLVAASYAMPNIVEELLQANPKLDAPDSRGNTPLHGAVEGNNEHIVRLLLDHNASVDPQNEGGETPLMRAQNKAIVDLLYDAGADVNAATLSGWTALMKAALQGAPEVVRALLSHGADANAVTDNGLTPVHIALQSKNRTNQQTILEVLIEFGAGINEGTYNGLTPLGQAAEYCNSAIVEALLNAGADVNATTINGDTPLHLALLSKENKDKMIEVVLQLVDAGADVTCTNTKGESALTLAVSDTVPQEVRAVIHMAAST